jgi:hypothetical protein
MSQRQTTMTPLDNQKTFTNRYGNVYWFEQVHDRVYVIRGDLKYWRYGGQEGQEHVDLSNLGFVDPSGGPFICVGYGIEKQPVVRIFVDGDDIMFEVADKRYS